MSILRSVTVAAVLALAGAVPALADGESLCAWNPSHRACGPQPHVVYVPVAPRHAAPPRHVEPRHVEPRYVAPSHRDRDRHHDRYRHAEPAKKDRGYIFFR
jgi:hypothetical protein